MILLTVDGIPVNAFIDKGAEATIMSEETYSKLPAKSPARLKKVSPKCRDWKRDVSNRWSESGIQNWHKKVGMDSLHCTNSRCPAPWLDSGKVFMGSELIPAYISEGKGPEYAISRVMLESDFTVPPECECLVWGVVDDPKPELPAVLEPVSLADGVSSGSIMIHMEQRIPVRLCNITASSIPLSRGVCLGVLIEAYPHAQEEGETSLYSSSQGTVLWGLNATRH